MNAELKPCPFCGESCNIAMTDNGWFIVTHNPSCPVDVGEFSNPKDLERMWNKRCPEKS